MRPGIQQNTELEDFWGSCQDTQKLCWHQPVSMTNWNMSQYAHFNLLSVLYPYSTAPSLCHHDFRPAFSREYWFWSLLCVIQTGVVGKLRLSPYQPTNLPMRYFEVFYFFILVGKLRLSPYQPTNLPMRYFEVFYFFILVGKLRLSPYQPTNLPMKSWLVRWEKQTTYQWMKMRLLQFLHVFVIDESCLDRAHHQLTNT
jgi:hypothetical protein